MAEFNNPQQEPGMERRLLLVFALTFLIIMLFQPLLKKYGPQAPAQPEKAAGLRPAEQPGAAVPTQAAENDASLRMAGQKGQSPVTTRASAPLVATSESETVIENDVYRIVFTNRGGRVKSWVLKKYTDDKGGQLELVNATASDKYGYPLTLWTYDEGLRNKVNSALYVTSTVPDVAPAMAPVEIRFVFSDGEVSVEKTFTFDRSTYVVGIKTAVYEKGAQVTAFPMWPAGFGADLTGSQYATGQILYQYDDKVERLAIKKINGGGTLGGPFHWAGVSDQYFAAVFLPQDPKNAAMVTLRNAIEIPHNSSDPNNKQMDKVDVLGAAVGSLKGATEARMYVGPKALADLQAVNVPGIAGAEPDLRAIIDFGWLGIIARPLFLWLKWMYSHIVANWGWAILLQTLVINVALLPLRLSQMKSMLKMQRVAPQIKSIQEKYKKYSLRDPKKAEMNTEISELYKREGVNPAGGCLPLVIQMPFLFAYYRMLNVAMDLRHAPWLWVHDLSAPDPHYILPIAIVVTMFFMQRMTPQAGMDPMQQKMMNFMMPAFMGYISFTLPAGLSLYWAMGQLIGIVQQAALNRSSLGREMREMMAKRARKKEK
ncbi:MAG: membrane protein insertase YidC [Acidobacteriia bacterium]|nr:membrane protein insertase YidC [Terriglobia bacterium]